MEGRKKILIAPMNWGLGHAARCVPLIRELLSRNAEVIIAADGRSLQLLRNEFPKLKWIQLPGYDIRYWWNRAMLIQLLLQLPKFIFSFYSERKWLKRLLKKEKIDAVISDNRYGLYSEKVHSIFITHQISIQLPEGFKWLDFFFYRINKKLIERFDECWVPDFEGEKNLSGILSHCYQLPVNAKFIGALSRFSFEDVEAKRDILIVISGPENQRTKFEKLLTKQAQRLSLKVLLVRGIPGSNQQKYLTPNFSTIDFMYAEELNQAFLSSKIIVARSGYSTIMDLLATKSKAILIPTPGQTEQEYLTDYLMEKNIFYSEPQVEFDLMNALERAKSFSGFSSQNENSFCKSFREEESRFKFLDQLFGSHATP